MIVRELLTLLGFTVDKASYDKAARQYDQLQGKLAKTQPGAQSAEDAHRLREEAKKAASGVGMLNSALQMAQRFAAQAGLSNLAQQWVQMASDVNETGNVLESVFGEQGRQQVEAWSEAQSQAMGRSKYSLQQYTSQLGAVLGPILGEQDRAREMSQSLAGLAVDLGSFFNATDEDAMRALRSGLTGEYESLKRFGVVLNDSTLAEIARTKGIKKKVTQMTVAEKTELRYAAIIERTKAAQGDAAKTGNEFANASKAVKEAMKDLGTDIGKTVLPKVKIFIRGLRDLLNWFNKAAKGSHVLEVAMYTLAGVAAILAAEFYSAFVLPALAIGALIVIIDELWTTLEGGDTILRRLIDGMFGEGTTAQVTKWIKDTFGPLMEAFEKLGAQGVWKQFQFGADNAGFAVQRLIEKIIDLVSWLTPMGIAWKGFKAGAQAAGLMDEDVQRSMGRGMDAPVAQSIKDELALRMRDQAAELAAIERRRAAAKREEQYGPSSFNMLDFAASQRAGLMPGVPSAGGAGMVGAPLLAPAGAGAPGPSSPTVNNSTTININGGDPAATKRVVDEALDARDKKTAAALGRRGRS